MAARRFLPDSSCLVAAACSWHEFNEVTLVDLERRLKRGEGIVLAGHALAEAYSVLTRLPSPHRVPPAEALAILEGSWARYPAVSLSADRYWRLLRDAGRASISGGLIYDALIAATARRAGAQVLLTWNVEHFARFSQGNLRILSPSRRD